MNLVNTELFEKILREKGLKKAKLCETLDISYTQLKRKITNEAYFKADEIQKLCKLFGVTSLKMKEAIFFNTDVDK